MKLPVKRLDPQAQIPEYKTAGAAAFDLAVIETKILAPGEIQFFRTGLVFCIPEGHFMLVASRSSNAVKKGINLANGVGIIDHDFCGENDELRLVVQNITRELVTISAGERVAQGIILPVERAQLVEVESTGAPDRGDYGTTGR